MIDGRVVTEGYTPVKVRVEPRRWLIFSGHLTAECWGSGGGGPACPMCLERRLPPALPEHSWPWVPRVGPGAPLVPVPERHDEDVVR